MAEALSFKLQVLSPEAELFCGAVTALTVPAAHGKLTVLPHHATLIAALTAGELVFHPCVAEQGSVQRIVLAGGFLTVHADVVTVLKSY